MEGQTKVQAQIVTSKDFKDGSTFPILLISARSQDSKEERDALKQIEDAMFDIVGKTYGGKIVSTQKGSGVHGILTIDMSAVLTMLQAVQVSSEKTSTANAWIRNWLKKKIKPEWLPTATPEKDPLREFTCRCGLVIKSRSKRKAKLKLLRHQKRCAVLKELQPFFARARQSLERVDNGTKEEKSVNKKKAGKTKRHKSDRVAKAEKVDSRTKTRRSSRNHHSKPRKKEV